MVLQGRKITVGITGGITAYKAAEIVSWLKASGAELQIAMTASACQLITPLTMKVLSGHPVATDIMDASANWHAPHIDLADCELYLLLPATANIMAKAAHGIADEVVSASLLANHAPVFCAPAMNTYMYENPATQHNMAILQERGWQMIEPDSSGLSGSPIRKGQLADIDTIKQAIVGFFANASKLAGKKVIVSAGPTYEFIDSVSFIGTRGSGKMGYALAEAAAREGAEVVLVAGPVSLNDPPGITVKHVVSASEMQDAILDEYDDADIVIMSAAVADYRPAKVADHKLKKGPENQCLEVVLTPDILAGLGKQKGSRFLAGFAAETDNLEQYAQGKLKEKNLDLVLANNVLEDGAGFDVDTNIITAIYGDKIERFPKMSKKQAAKEIIDLIVKLLG